MINSCRQQNRQGEIHYEKRLLTVLMIAAMVTAFLPVFEIGKELNRMTYNGKNKENCQYVYKVDNRESPNSN